jgi:hypothetical protein
MAQWIEFVSILALGLAVMCLVLLDRLERFHGYQPTSWKNRRASRRDYTPRELPEKNPDNLSDDNLASMRQFSGFVQYVRKVNNETFWNFQDTGILRKDRGWGGGAFRTIEIRHNRLLIGSIEIVRRDPKDKELEIILTLTGARRFNGSGVFGFARSLSRIVNPGGLYLESTNQNIYRNMLLHMWQVAEYDGEGQFIGSPRRNQPIIFTFYGTVDYWLERKEEYEQIKYSWNPPLETLHHSP